MNEAERRVAERGGGDADRGEPCFSLASNHGITAPHSSANCCWCGARVPDLASDAMRALERSGHRRDREIDEHGAVKKVCPDCGKPNVVWFRWDLSVYARPDQ